MESKLDMDIRRQLKERSDDHDTMPEYVRGRWEQALTDLPDLPTVPSRNRAFRKLLIVASVLFILLGGIVTSGFVSPVMAETLKQIPFIGQIFETIGDERLQVANSKGLTVSVNKSATDQGITLTVKEVMFDGIRLIIGMEEQSTKQLPSVKEDSMRYNEIGSRVQATVNGAHFGSIEREKVSMQGVGRVISMLEIQAQFGEDPEDIEKLGDSFTLELEIPQVGTVKGHWVLQIPIQRQSEHTYKQIPMMEKKRNEVTMFMRSVATSPLGTELNFHMSIPSDNAQANDEMWGLAFTATDEYGYPLEDMGGGGHMFNDIVWDQTLSFAPLPESSKTIVFKPYSSLGKRGSGFGSNVSKLNSLPHTIQQGDIGQATITKIEKLEEKTLLHFEVIGSLPTLQSVAIDLIQSGEKIERKDVRIVGRNKDAFMYVQELAPIDKQLPIRLYTYTMPQIDFHEELEMRFTVRN
ncbi:DUF4179 domain-containing protein [Paenibacillus sp. GSMTC-2017]|uniref:DUF4179 domain-containing protein n=1 Tax=Paenibacillus sp. GSMTC-2017 TaxID=2794350 RepID=UPI0018D85435|nr:DUF4179 domain-containing protein [Paenibacillus sp. GSMTC-2017]MBH5316384.1 DUF4179 domain-containing protein [Paenibacillus sp. GSMTC-2017]